MTFLGIIILSTFLAMFAARNDFTEEPCLTLLSRNGVCVPYTKCSYLHQWSAKYNGVLPYYLKDYIFHSKCSKDNESVIRICCDTDNTESTTTTTSTTTASFPEQNDISYDRDLDLNANFLDQLNSEGYNILNDSHCGKIGGDRIAGGVEVVLNEFPWMALLKLDGPSGGEFKCGGTLITRQHVLTAAHCVTGMSPVIGVRLGEHNITTDPDCIMTGMGTICNSEVDNYGIEKVIPHPQYKKRNHENDIALIKLDREVQFKNNIQPICLPITPVAREIPTEFCIAGWGTTEKGFRSQVLLKARVNYLENSVCQKSYSHINMSATKHMCAGDRMSGRDTCSGDSGGPLMQISNYKRHKVFVQYGVVSAGAFGCKLSTALPGIYANVLNYLPWITNTIVQ